MHDTAISNIKRFIDTYLKHDKDDDPPQKTLIEIGSQSYLDQFNFRELITSHHIKYIGLDCQAGENVDIVMQDPYKIPMEDHSIDYVISTSCFEHLEFFWLMFLEIMRVLKDGGLFYLNAPSNGAFHRFPVDCWRFYPDSANALAKWSKYNGIECEVLEQYTSLRENDLWFDYIAIFHKGTNNNYDKRIIHKFNHYINGSTSPNINVFKNLLHYINVCPNPF